jgi:hypothetical protein
MPGLGSEGGYLADGMDARIRASCQLNTGGAPKEHRRRAFQLLLDGPSIRLDL